VEIDAGGGSAWAETGATAGGYTLATADQRRVTGFGDNGAVGIGGITLAGGIGFLARKTGLTIDNLLAAEVVTADGRVVQASQDSDPDLFWAIRGGEGNFGVATRFQLRLAEISEVVGGTMILPASPQVITGFLEAAREAPEELSTIANVTLAPPMPFVPKEAHGTPVVIGLFAYVGPVDQGEQVIAPFRALAEPLADMVRPMRYPELYEGPPREVNFAAGTNFFAESLEPAGAEAILEQLPKSTAPMRAVQLRAGAGPKRRHRVRASRPGPVRERRGDVHGRRGEGHPRRLGQRRRGLARQGRSGRLRRLPRRRGRGDNPRRLPRRDLGPPPRAEAPLRPRQPLPRKPQHPAGRRVGLTDLLRPSRRRAGAEAC
jgi:hypothetical protein